MTTNSPPPGANTSPLLSILTSPFIWRLALCFTLFGASVFALVHWAHLSWFNICLLAFPLFFITAIISFGIGRSRKSFDVETQTAYDKAKDHYDSDFPKGLAPKQALVHTGMFIGWLIEHDLIAPDFRVETEGFKERRVTGAEVYEAWDGCLTREMLTEEGNRFASDYFDFQRGEFLNDYEQILAKGLPSVFHVPDTWENYEIIRQKIDQRFEHWKKNQKS